jgi:hypothetical protein
VIWGYGVICLNLLLQSSLKIILGCRTVRPTDFHFIRNVIPGGNTMSNDVCTPCVCGDHDACYGWGCTCRVTSEGDE